MRVAVRELHPCAQMRGFPALAFAAVCLLPAGASAQETVKMIVPRVPVASVPPAVFTEVDGDSPAVAAKRLADQFYDRLQPIEQRVREDQRLRCTSEMLGVSAVALGALRGGTSLTFLGTQALRLGFDRQLTQIRHRTGYYVNEAKAAPQKSSN